MARRYVLSVSARNRVGFTAALAKALDELGANLCDISQARLDQIFLMILLADFPSERDPEVIQDHIRAVCRPFKAAVTIQEAIGELDSDAEMDTISDQPPVPFLLTVSGKDRPGILRLLSRHLAQHGIDMLDLRATRTDGNTKFLFVIHLNVPHGISAMQLEQELKQIDPQNPIEVHLQHGRLIEAITSVQSITSFSNGIETY